MSESKLTHYIVGYTEEYREKNWRKCRFGKDLRACPGYFSLLEEDGKFHIHCKSDKKPCDAKWQGDKDS
jgi:hypothetical protein